MRKTTISLADTGAFPSLLTAYLAGSDKLNPFYSYSPSLKGFEDAIGSLAINTDRSVLTNEIAKQYSDIHISETTKKNIGLLSDERTFTVTTGHQLRLFTGPLYFIYKIVTTINLAAELKRAFPSYEFVPVYWMASEDHDFEEVNHVHVYGKTLVWEQEKKGAVGDIPTGTLENILGQLEQMLANEPHGSELVSLLRKAYNETNDLAAATRLLVNELFGERGLVIIDPSSPVLKKLFAGVMADDIFSGTAAALVTETINSLKDAGAHSQVTPRRINLFYMRDGLRERIEQEGEAFKVLNTDIAFTREEIQKELNDHPERLSPNVVLRPLYQQHILPNIAYIGGPAEVAYWFEYKKMFDHYATGFPVLMPRNFVMLFDAAVNERLARLEVSKKEIFTETEALIRDFVSSRSGESLDISAEEEQLKKLYSGLAAKAEKIDPTLGPSVEAELQKQLNALKNLQGKLLRAEKQRQETSVNQLRKMKEKLFPGGVLQERYDNFVPYYARHGRSFIGTLMEELDPFDFSMILLDLE